MVRHQFAYSLVDNLMVFANFPDQRALVCFKFCHFTALFLGLSQYAASSGMRVLQIRS